MNDYIKTMRQIIGNKPLMICGAGIIVYSNGKVLLQLRKDNGCWCYHGGAVEIDEEVESAAKRELFEETGLIANKLELFGVYSGADLHYIYPNGDEVSIIDILYVCEEFSGEMVKVTNETDDLQWFDINNIPENISPPTKRQLNDFVKTKKA